MKKGQQKLYQKMTANEIIDQLGTFVEYYKVTQDRMPACMIAAIEYINLHERKEKECLEKEK